jgi:hypothetical protein
MINCIVGKIKPLQIFIPSIKNNIFPKAIKPLPTKNDISCFTFGSAHIKSAPIWVRKTGP